MKVLLALVAAYGLGLHFNCRSRATNGSGLWGCWLLDLCLEFRAHASLWEGDLSLMGPQYVDESFSFFLLLVDRFCL